MGGRYGAVSDQVFWQRLVFEREHHLHFCLDRRQPRVDTRGASV